jgi:5-hydroxyisourate hydrolase
MKDSISTHVLDTTSGRPAAGLTVRLEALGLDGHWMEITHGATDVDGRISNLLGDDGIEAEGMYRMTFDVGEYFRTHGHASIYRQVPVVFVVDHCDGSFHIPLLLSPNGYTTYRGR